MAGSERGAACAGTGGLSSFALKAVAIVGMTANHAGYQIGRASCRERV